MNRVKNFSSTHSMYFKIALSNMAQDKAISLAVKGDYLAPLSLPR